MLSDTHGFVDPQVVQLVSRCTLAVHAGDIGSVSVLQSLEPESGLVIAVTGNNDVEWKWDETDIDILRSLPETQHIKLPGGVITVEHGHQVRNPRRYHEELRARHPASRVVIYGHTHNRVMDTGEVPWVLNPGAAGRDRTQGGPSCLIVEVESELWNVEEYCF